MISRDTLRHYKATKAAPPVFLQELPTMKAPGLGAGFWFALLCCALGSFIVVYAIERLT